MKWHEVLNQSFSRTISFVTSRLRYASSLVTSKKISLPEGEQNCACDLLLWKLACKKPNSMAEGTTVASMIQAVGRGEMARRG